MSFTEICRQKNQSKNVGLGLGVTNGSLLEILNRKAEPGFKRTTTVA